MSDSAPSATPEPTPFDKFKEFARRIIAVPKAEADEKEQEWRETRKKATELKKSADPR
jgi:hypothetical protein